MGPLPGEAGSLDPRLGVGSWALTHGGSRRLNVSARCTTRSVHQHAKYITVHRSERAAT